MRLRSDEQLVALFRAGSDDAFRVIHDRYRARLFAYARQMLGGSRSDAEDALQDVFLRAYSTLRADDRPVVLKAWLYRVAHNRCVDDLRRPVPPAADVFELSRTPLPDPLAEAERRDDLRRLVADVQRLPEQQRSALLMRELEGLSYADLAAALDTTVPAVKSLLVRARIGLVEAAEARDTACAEIRDDLALAHGRGVRASARARRHMRDCKGCRAYRRELRAVHSGLQALAPPTSPFGLIAKLLGIGGASGGAAAGGGAAAAGGGAAAAGGGAAAAGGGAAAAVGGGVVAGTTAKVAAVVCCAAITAVGPVEIASRGNVESRSDAARSGAGESAPVAQAAKAAAPAAAPAAPAAARDVAPDRRAAKDADHGRRAAGGERAVGGSRADDRARDSLAKAVLGEEPISPHVAVDDGLAGGAGALAAEATGGTMAPPEKPVTTTAVPTSPAPAPVAKPAPTGAPTVVAATPPPTQAPASGGTGAKQPAPTTGEQAPPPAATTATAAPAPATGR